MPAFVIYEYNREIYEDFLFCKPLPSHTTAENIFDTLNEFIVFNKIHPTKCVEVSTDRAWAMVEKLTGVVKRVKDMALLVTAVHCSIHREALATKTMPADMVLDEAVRTVKFIKSRSLWSHLFAILCVEMGSDHRPLLLHTEVRWLSSGKVLTKFFKLLDGRRTFFADTRFRLSYRFCDFEWLPKLAYFVRHFRLFKWTQSISSKEVTMY